MKIKESWRTGISFKQYRQKANCTGHIFTSCIETAFYNMVLKERYREDRSDGKRRKKTLAATGRT
jgi:hypothetical protein